MGSAPTLPVVLLVEDNPDDALLASLALQDAGLANPLVHVEDGHEALARCREESVALLLLDLRLPRLDGTGVIAALREEPPPVPPVVFVLAASDDAPTAMGLDRDDVDAVLLKPLRPDDFLDALAGVDATAVVVQP